MIERKHSQDQILERNEFMRNLAAERCKKLRDKRPFHELKFLHEATEAGVYFNYQHPIFIYDGLWIERLFIADFYDPVNKVVIEVDGGYHNTEEQKERDAERDYILRKWGYKVHRITNATVAFGYGINELYDVYSVPELCKSKEFLSLQEYMR